MQHFGSNAHSSKQRFEPSAKTKHFLQPNNIYHCQSRISSKFVCKRRNMRWIDRLVNYLSNAWPIFDTCPLPDSRFRSNDFYSVPFHWWLISNWYLQIYCNIHSIEIAIHLFLINWVITSDNLCILSLRQTRVTFLLVGNKSNIIYQFLLAFWRCRYTRTARIQNKFR